MAAKFSVSQVTTFHQTFEEDVETYRQAGVEGMGIWEFKLGEGNDADLLARIRDAGIKATTCIPGVLSVYPVPFPGPDDPRSGSRRCVPPSTASRPSSRR